jgi:predicted aspartyl protease
MRPRLFWLLAVLAIVLSPRAMAAPQPFQLLEGQVVMTVTIGGREILALVDTGSERSMIEAELAGELGLKTKMPTGSGAFGASGKPVRYARTDDVEMIVGGQTRRLSLTVFPSGSAFAAKDVRILIGRNVLGGMAVAIDFERMTIDLTPSAKFRPPEGAPLQLPDPSGWGGPVLRIDVNGKAADVVLDTAATGSLHLTSRFVRDAGLVTGRQTSTKRITGIDGSYERKAIVLPTVTIAGAPFKKVEATILSLGQVGRSANPIDGVVGVYLLRQFNLIIDYRSNQVWLTPNRKMPN